MLISKGAIMARDLGEFLASMPAAYARAFPSSAVEEHARIVARRGNQLAHAEEWGSFPDRARVCVVADDRPGLLSLITSALIVNGLNIASAQVYCRRRDDGTTEAVDFFSLEAADAQAGEPAIEPSGLANFVQTLSDLIAEEQVAAGRQTERDTIPVPGPKPSRVYFDIQALSREEYILIVETPDYPGLLSAISSALHGENVRILWSDVRTEDGVARDRFGLASGTLQALDAERLCDVQQAVLAAVLAEASARSPF
jgi:UTP:GlnB (protein PII) uridylyltransferase